MTQHLLHSGGQECTQYGICGIHQHVKIAISLLLCFLLLHPQQPHPQLVVEMFGGHSMELPHTGRGSDMAGNGAQLSPQDVLRSDLPACMSHSVYDAMHHCSALRNVYDIVLCG